MKKQFKYYLGSMFLTSLMLSSCFTGNKSSHNSSEKSDDIISEVISENNETSISLKHNDILIYEEDTFTLEVDCVNVSGALFYKSSDESVATVENGVIKALKEGSTVISVSYEDVMAVCNVVVKKQVSFGFNYDNITIYRSKTTQLNATYLFKGEEQLDKTIYYSSSDDSIASIDENGYVTAKKQGDVVITATCGELTSTINVKIANLIDITLNVEEAVLNPNDNTNNKLTITATVSKNGISVPNASVSWSCIDESVLTLNTTKNVAQVTASGCGNSAIVAEFDGEIATCIVTSYKTVKTVADMEAIKNDFNGWYKVENDIDFTGYSWAPIAPWIGDNIPIDSYFGGIFDGQGYTLSNLSFMTTWHAALFGEVSPSGVVKNVSLTNATHTSTSMKTGSIVSLNHGKVENIYAEITMSADSQSMWNASGGLVATNHPDAIIRNCVVRVNAKRVLNNTGAIIGYNCSEVTNVYAICEDAILPAVYTMTSDLGTLNNSYVVTDESKLYDDELYSDFDKYIWTTTGYDLPSLKTFSRVDFKNEDTYLTVGQSYVINPSNVLGINQTWEFEGDKDAFDIYFEENGSLNITPLRLGTLKATVTLDNGHKATTNFIGKNVVLVPSLNDIKLDYNNPRLTSSTTIELIDENNNFVPNGNVEFVSENESIVSVDSHGVLTAKSGGSTSISVLYNGDLYSNLIKVDVTPWIAISTVADLNNMRNNLSAKYCLVNDIDYKGNTYSTIGPWSVNDLDGTHFSGTFDGNGYTISNLVLPSGNDTYGIWGQTTESSVIRNTNFKVKGCNAITNASGIVGFNEGLIENCYVEFEASYGGSSAIKGAGTIVGTNEFRGIVRDCIVLAKINNLGNSYLGTICGLNQGSIENTFAMIYGAGSANKSTIAYDNGFSSELSQYEGSSREEAISLAYTGEAPFGSYSKEYWNIVSNSIPTLKRIS